LAKIPENVNEWSRGILVDLLDEGYDENLRLEFKSKIDAKTKRIPITACAFTNTKGGFLVFGIDNNRNKKLSTEQKLVGLEDSDQLKSKINNQIRNIKLGIPIENIEFKEANISLPNGKVIVVLKISKSVTGPHQFENIFYKRVANGNSPMDIDEIKNAFIESQKSSRMLTLIKTEERYTIDVLNAMNLLIDNKQIERALSLIPHLNYSAFKHFLYNHSNFYDIQVQNLTADLVHELDRLERNVSPIRNNIAQEEYYDEAVSNFKLNVTNSIDNINDFNQRFDIVPSIRNDGFLDTVKEELKDETSKAIKEKKVSEEKIKDTTPKQV